MTLFNIVLSLFMFGIIAIITYVFNPEFKDELIKLVIGATSIICVIMFIPTVIEEITD